MNMSSGSDSDGSSFNGSGFDGSGFDGSGFDGIHDTRSGILDLDSVCSDSVGCDSSDDDVMSLRLVGDDHARRKFRRLQRIFLSRPQTSKSVRSKGSSKTMRRRSSVESADDSDEESVPTCLPRSDRAAGNNQRADQQKRQQSHQALGLSVPVGLLQEEIDRQMRALCEQLELLAARRDSSAKQRENDLRRAIEELQLVKLRQRQVLETQTRTIEESYALRLEVLERQYQATVAEVRREMRAAVQKQREECENTVLSAVKELQLQTQANLLGEMTSHKIDALVTPASEGKPGDRDAWTFRERVRCSTARPVPVSPMTRQRAKLKAFEQKLRSLPQASVHRVTSQRQRESPNISVDTSGVGFNPELANCSRWQPAPLSPLRSSPSKWKRGVSREAARVNERFSVARENNNYGKNAELGWEMLTRRYLRPDEERELVRLRNSIGLAKDWMENNVHEG